MAASSFGGTIDPVGLAGLARTRPAGTASSASSMRIVGWKRVPGPQGMAITVQPSAVSMFRYAGYPGWATTTTSPGSNAARNASRNAPDDPVLTATSPG